MKLRYSKEQLEYLLDLPEFVHVLSVSQRDDDILVEVGGEDLIVPEGVDEAPAMYTMDDDGVLSFAGYEPTE